MGDGGSVVVRKGVDRLSASYSKFPSLASQYLNSVIILKHANALSVREDH